MISFALSQSLLHSGCASVPDVPVCVEVNPSKGFCVNTISDKEFFVDDENKLEGQTWWDLRPTMVQVPSTSWEKIKGFIIKECKRSKACQEEVSSWSRKVEGIDSQVKENSGN